LLPSSLLRGVIAACLFAALAPAITAVGGDNAITPGGDGPASAALVPPVPAEPPAPAVIPALPPRLPGTLHLRGDGITRQADCTDRNVLIEGSNSRFTLTGGCRSVTVTGHANAITAGLQPGARIAISGDGVTLHYHLTAPGTPPIISVTGRNSAAARLPASGARR